LDLKKREKLIKGWDVKIKKKKIKGSTLLPIISCTYLPHFPFMSIFITWSYFRKFHLSIMYFIFVFWDSLKWNVISSYPFVYLESTNIMKIDKCTFIIDLNNSFYFKNFFRELILVMLYFKSIESWTSSYWTKLQSPIPHILGSNLW
jgi:hypothetical protein